MHERGLPATVEPEKAQDKCGLVALRLPSASVKDQLSLVLIAGGGIQHRGQQKAGMIMRAPEELVGPVGGNGLIKDVLSNGALAPFLGKNEATWELLHAHYSTYGGTMPENLQPSVASSADGKTWSVIHNGQFVANDQLRDSLNDEYPPDISDTYLFTKLLAETEGETADERVLNALAKVDGAYSLAIGVDDAVYLARDKSGIRPFVVGKINDGFIAASETFALEKVGVNPEFQIRRGEVVKIDDNGLHIIQDGFDDQGFPCVFEFAYFSHPRSKTPVFVDPSGQNSERWQSVYGIRERSGIILAEELRESGKMPDDIDFVVGVPDSGVPFASGLAMGAGLPYRPVLIRDHYDQNGERRLFQEAEIDTIAARINGKVGPVNDRSIFEGKKILVGDDSIVRSNVGKQIVTVLKNLGAAEVHVAGGYPPVIRTCHLGVSMRTPQELVAAQFEGDREKIAEHIGADSVHYISHIGLLRAMGKRKEDIAIPENPNEIFHANDTCGGCLTGVYPISENGVIYLSELKKQKEPARLVFAAGN